LRRILTITAIFLGLFWSTISYGQTIKGIVVDERYFPVPGVTIQIEGGGSTATDTLGQFSIPVEKRPYNLTLIDRASAVAVRYEELTSLEPELKMFGISPGKYTNSEVLKVNFPEVPGGTSAIIKFLSMNQFSSQEVTATSGETSKTITVDWPKSKDVLNGFVVYLSKTGNNYNKYAEYPVTLYRGSNIIQSADIQFPGTSTNPGSSTLTVYLPNYSYNSKGYSVYADFLGLNRNASILLSSGEADIRFTKVLVPEKLPFAFRLKVSGKGSEKNGSGFVNYSYSSPNAVINLESETPPEILAPQDKLIGYYPTTVFSYETGSGTGVFVVHFHSFFPEADFYIVTRNWRVSSPVELSGGIISGNEYQWGVTKYMTYFDVNDFVKPLIFQNDVGYKAVTHSEKRTFKKTF
jgi:hypothetical protein